MANNFVHANGPVDGEPMEAAVKFREELGILINKHSKESSSNTPDFILATYLESCLKAFDRATHRREVWYGRTAWQEDKPICAEGPSVTQSKV